ncbi:aldo/keto reductase [Agromyces sp. S2-1-8]|uniref:aldo/keto reductase n=1 Tax=Agromyces sp. S2-1-8 TaxID=2897180 RepID=UPI001E614F08|nr:aldo/keto reductase [Agromyces sp. S2-1-8]MCD5344912.1 aldo/keto reductase [Agromyces sp. S2-1-8]
MRTRQLANGLALTEIGLGAAQFGNLFRESTDEASDDAVDAAWSAGIRYFDTAPHYGLGLSERRLGSALKEYPRDEYVVSTKVGRLLVHDPSGAGRLDEGFVVPATTRREWDFSRDGILRSLESSLDRLGLAHVDIVYLHDPDQHEDQASREAFPALIELREQGVVRAIGAGMNQSAMLDRFVVRHDIDVVMLAGRYTLLEQPALDDLLPRAVERGVSVVAAGVYNSGLLASPRPQADAKYDYQAAPAELVRRANAIADVCDEFGITLPDAAVAFPLRHPAVASVVVGTRTADHVSSSVERYSKPIPDEFWGELIERGLLRPDVLG